MAKIDESSFNELVLFVRKQIREYDMMITRETLIEDDLGVTGDDAEELIISFSKKYNIDISNFPFGDYFYEEPNIFKKQNKRIKPFTIGDLEKALSIKRLDAQVVNS